MTLARYPRQRIFKPFLFLDTNPIYLYIFKSWLNFFEEWLYRVEKLVNIKRMIFRNLRNLIGSLYL